MSGRVAVAVVGATATGKSAVAHAYARQHPGCEIVMADAMAVYRGMDLATAKPTPAQRAEVRYHLVDVVEPAEVFTVAAWQAAARAALADVWARGACALVVGGTGLYIRALVDSLRFPGQFPALRAELEERAARGEDLAALLGATDPRAAALIEPTNARRVVRALEVTLGSSRPFSSYGPGLSTYGPPHLAQVGLRVPLAELDTRIEERLRAWMADGLVEEVRALAARPGGLSATARQAVGYRELLDWLELGGSLENAVAAAVAASRRLARRQVRWFTRDPRIEWFDDPENAAARLEALVNDREGSVRDWDA